MVSVKPTAKVYKVIETKEIPFEGIKATTDIWNIFRPYIKTKKSFAGVKISLGLNPTTKAPIYVWVDGRDMVTFKKSVSGLGWM